EHRLPQDGRFKIEGEREHVSIRVSIIPIMDGEKVVMRLLREEVAGLTLESLGLEGKALESIRLNLKKPNGLILVTGPTGSGKTTTLYALMDILNTPGVNIATVEDPIEYRMPRINQTQVKPEIGLTFAAGLRSLVRQDPDIIMVGEIRDNETASLAINAALTGHLVLSTLHTNSAAGALPRLLDMKVEPFLIASTTNIIIAQRLVRKLCQDAKESYALDTSEIEALSRVYDMAKLLEVLKEKRIVKKDASWESITFWRPKPSRDCPEGYKSRIGIFEVLPMTEKIRKLVTAQATSDEIQDEGIKEGMTTMFEDGFIKAAKGITSIEEVLRVTKE
ncbi:MAG: type II/IV secretion system protein, partial [Candidatus Portnoybacteria bacterium]|nr:type II/IV secretion system protein [Candidatus Portnoybacteria bacterium]